MIYFCKLRLENWHENEGEASNVGFQRLGETEEAEFGFLTNWNKVVTNEKTLLQF